MAFHESQVKTVVILSGGVDSTVILWECLNFGIPTKTISFDYGQRHKRELTAAAEIADLANVEHRVVAVPSWGDLIRATALTGGEVPQGHYEDPLQKTTVVPNRNMVFISIAASWAMAIGYSRVAIGAHLGDREIYLDCRREFMEQLGGALMLSDERRVKIWYPFVSMPKSEVVKRGIELGAPLHKTWTCYVGEETPCGKCGACVERMEAESRASIS